VQTHVHGTGGLAVAALLVVLVVAAGLGVYVVAAHRLRRDGIAWPRSRDGCAVAAAAGLIVAVSSPLAGGEFLAHMSRHVVVGMVSPLFIVLAVPGTLALRALRGANRRSVLAVLHSRPVSWLVNPPIAALVNVGSIYVLYRTPLLAASQADPWLDGLVHVHLLVTGVLFTVAVCQLDPLRRRYSLPLRAAAMVVAAAAHGVLSKTMYATPPPNTAFDVADLQAGAQLMYYSGDVVEIAMAIVLAVTWYTAGGRALDRARRRAAGPGPATGWTGAPGASGSRGPVSGETTDAGR
jgi:putative membrane protein